MPVYLGNNTFVARVIGISSEVDKCSGDEYAHWRPKLDKAALEAWLHVLSGLSNERMKLIPSLTICCEGELHESKTLKPHGHVVFIPDFTF